MQKYLLLIAVFLSAFPARADVRMTSAADIYHALAQGETPRKILVPVMVGGQQVAEAHVDGDMRIDARDLAPWVNENMNTETQRAFESSAWSGTVAAGRITEGLGVVYDPEWGVLRLVPDAAFRKTHDISVKAPPIAIGEAVMMPATASGFLNARGGVDYLFEGAGDEGRQPFRLDLAGAANFRGWVLEGESDYFESASRPWQRDNTRLVRDLPDKMVRLAAGDLSYPVSDFQSYQPILGVSVARNFSLQPYRVTAPTGETSFVVRTPSRVDIVVNGQRIRTLRLDPGSYDVSDFPVADGSNEVTLVITDATGNVERKTFPLLSDQELLAKGLHAYAYNAGVVSETVDRKIEYHAHRPALSLFHRYGFTDTLTAGVSAQGDENVQQTGISVLKAFSFGTTGFEAAGSHMDEKGFDGAGAVFYRLRNIEKRRDFAAQLRYRGQDFAALGQAAPSNPSSFEAAARYNQTVYGDVNMGIGGRYRFGRDAFEDDWSYSANFSKALPHSLSLSVTAEHRRTDGAGVFLTLSWTPPQSRHSLSSSVDTIAGTQEAQWNYRAERDVQSLSASAGVARDNDGEEQATGSLSYRGYRGEASLTHDMISHPDGREADSRSQLLFGTALTFADGYAALSRPVTGSFVMLPRHKTLSEYTVGVNPDSGDDVPGYQAEIDGMGPAVLPDATPYMYRSVRIDTRRLPAGYDVGRDAVTVLPGYKSGTLLVVGNAANIYADGYLLTAKGAPVGLQGGTIRGEKSEQEFFTNAKGRFRISRLEPGDYEISLHDRADAKIPLTVPDMGAGRFDAGVLVLRGEEVK